MMEGGKEEVRKGRRRRGDLQPLPVQTVVALICSISTITGSASSLVVMRVIFTRTEEPRERRREREKEKNWKVRKAFCCDTKNTNPNVHKENEGVGGGIWTLKRLQINGIDWNLHFEPIY